MLENLLLSNKLKKTKLTKANFLDGSFRGFRWLLGFGFEFDCQPKPKQWI
jgi:hypothetical protein